jgi:uncharacterized protein (TIGR04255 family)
VVEQGATGNQASLTRASEAGISADTLSVILDIDAFRAHELLSERSAIEPILETLRNLKNQIFFGSVTEALLEAYR